LPLILPLVSENRRAGKKSQTAKAAPQAHAFTLPRSNTARYLSYLMAKSHIYERLQSAGFFGFFPFKSFVRMVVCGQAFLWLVSPDCYCWGLCCQGRLAGPITPIKHPEKVSKKRKKPAESCNLKLGGGCGGK
jgi:hypothetical protein